METFKAVLGYEGLYEISDCGNIRSLIQKPPRLMKPGIGTSGYCYVLLSKNGQRLPKQIHRLVLEAFEGRPKTKLEANHKNGIKTDNRLDNLEWTTRSENLKHRIYILGIVPEGVKGSENHNAIFTEDQIRRIRDTYARGISYSQIAASFGCTKSTICHIVKRRSWRHVY